MRITEAAEWLKIVGGLSKLKSTDGLPSAIIQVAKPVQPCQRNQIMPEVGMCEYYIHIDNAKTYI